MTKRIISLLLVLCSLLAVLPMAVSAQELQTISSGWQAANSDRVGPLPDREIADPIMPRSAEYLNEEQAMAYLRSQMEKRVSPITFNYFTTSTVKESAQALFPWAAEHTGVPTQGDYILRHTDAWAWKASYYDGTVKKITITYEIDYYTTATQESQVDARVDSLLYSLNLWNSSDYQKIKGIYDYITDNVVYDNANLNNDSYGLKYTAYAALFHGTAVCQGYANLFYRLALELGVDARLIAGIGNGGPHGWNIVKLNGKYYNVDATWDAGNDVYEWFLKSPASFVDHDRDSEFETAAFHASYPMSSTDFQPTSLKITQQPKSVTVANGQTAKVTVTAQGDGLKYYWYYANPGDTEYTYTSSFTGNTYSVTMNDARNGRYITCIVMDMYGNYVQTDEVVLRMGTTLKITSQPVSVTVASGKTAAVTVKAQGDGLKYKWYYRNAGDSNFAYTSTFTGNTYSVTMTSGRAGRQVYCVVTDQYGVSVKSNTVTLGMPTAVKITTQPVSVAVANGQTAKVTVKAQGDGLTYKWYYADAGSSTFKLTTSFKGSSYSVSMTDARAGRRIYCVITDQYGNSVRSNTVTLNKKTPLKIVTQPSSVTVDNGAYAKVTVKAQGDGLTYEWYFADPKTGTFSKTTAFKGSSYNVQMNASRAGRIVYCVITDKYGDSVTTQMAVLNRTSTLKITSQPTSVAVAAGKTAKVTVGVSGQGLKFQWFYADAGSAAFKLTTAFKTNSYSVAMTNARAGRRVYCVITDKYGNIMVSNVVTLNQQ